MAKACLPLQDAAPGIASHGYITGVKPYGIFVSFCGGIKGLAHTAELPLAPDQKPADAYKVGQVLTLMVLPLATTANHKVETHNWVDDDCERRLIVVE